MPFRDRLRKRLEDRVPSEALDYLPGGYQALGSIVLIKLDKKLLKHRKLIGKGIMELFPYVRTVCLVKDIGKTIRKPRIEVIAGCNRTQTLNKEHGCQFLLDVSDIMWSKGNKNERTRLVNEVKPKETIVDMFAGIGYFSIVLAKHCDVKIYAIDINPKAIEYLRKNVWLNNVENKVEVLEGDCRKFSRYLENSADRVIMGYLFDTEKFLPYAIRTAKSNAFIHLHRNVREPEIDRVKEKIMKIGERNKVRIKILRIKKVKSYSPKTWHVVFDLKIRKLNDLNI
jgi:tRNA wybutosine-synthesizing protein 2